MKQYFGYNICLRLKKVSENRMKRNIPLIQSGISLVDQAWGGFYKGGTYLLIGPRKSGKTLLGLQYALQAARQKEVCLYFTTMRPKDLMIHAASIDFDLQSYMNQNLIVVVRVAPPTDLYDLRNPDDYLVEYMKDIVTVVNQFQPNRIIFDEFTPYIGFSNLEALRHAFLQTIEIIEEKDIISLYVLGEPATPVAQSIVDILAQHVTAVLYLQKKSGIVEGKNSGGKITITPNIGHTEGQFTANYYVEPYRGIIVDYKPKGFQPPVPNMPQQSFNPPVNKPVSKDSKYLTLSNFEMPAESYSFSNLYDYNDFLLILNNQIALYKSTGQIFNLVSFKLDPAVEQSGILTINQLQNAIRLASDKKDKICVSENKVMILITRSDKKSVPNLISKIQSNLPSSEPGQARNLLQYISVLSLESDERIENAESMMSYIFGEENTPKNNNDTYNNYSF